MSRSATLSFFSIVLVVALPVICACWFAYWFVTIQNLFGLFIGLAPSGVLAWVLNRSYKKRELANRIGFKLDDRAFPSPEREDKILADIQIEKKSRELKAKAEAHKHS